MRGEEATGMHVKLAKVRHHPRVGRDGRRIERTQTQAVQARGPRQGHVCLTVFKRVGNGQFQLGDGHALRFVHRQRPRQRQGHLLSTGYHLAILFDCEIFLAHDVFHSVGEQYLQQ